MNTKSTPVYLRDDDGSTTESYINPRHVSTEVTDDFDLKLENFRFSVEVKSVGDSFAVVIQACRITDRAKGFTADQPVWSVEFEELVGFRCEEEALIPVRRVSELTRTIILAEITGQYVAKVGKLKFGSKTENLFVGLEIDETYYEAPLSYSDARRMKS